MQLIPAIDLRGGRVVRLERGDDARRTAYADDPVAVLERFADAGASLIHVVDLDAAFGEAAQWPAVHRLVGVARGLGAAVELGGGLRDGESVARALDAGVARVVLGSLALRAPDVFAALADAHPGKLVPALELLDGRLRDAGWRASSSERPADAAARLGRSPCPAVLVTDIARDGLLVGPNVALARDIAQWSGLPAVLSGGVHALEDLRRAARVPEIAGVVVGKALYDGRFTVGEALAACREAS